MQQLPIHIDQQSRSQPEPISTFNQDSAVGNILPVSRDKKNPLGFSGLSGFITTILFLLTTSLLVSGCSGSSQNTEPTPIADASAFIQGDDLYARASLNPRFSKHVIMALRHGEPMQATYRFNFFRYQTLLPDLPLAKISIKKRLRLRLVTQKYEMHDLNNNRINYTSDPEEAIRFFSNPRFVLLGKEVHLKDEFRYWLQVEFEIDHQGMSPMFRTLKRWLTIDHTIDYQFRVDYEKS